MRLQINPARNDETYRIARGTMDVTSRVPPVLAGDPATVRREVPETRLEELRSKAIRALQRTPLSASAIARATDATASEISRLMTDMSDEQLVLDIGTGTSPVWAMRLDSASTDEEVLDFIRRLVELRPATMQELADASGARIARVRWALKTLHESGARLVKMCDSDSTTRWFLMGEARHATLRPRRG